MERVIVLGLRGCRHCNALIESLNESNISFEFRDADSKEHTKLADTMEALLKTQTYPIVILERIGAAKYLYLVDSIEEAKESSVGFATKVGCVSTDSMVALIEKYSK